MSTKLALFLAVVLLYVFLLKGYSNLLLATVVFAYFTEVFIEIFSNAKSKITSFFEKDIQPDQKHFSNYLFNLFKKLQINILFVYAFYFLFIVFLILFIFIPVLNQVSEVIKKALGNLPMVINKLDELLTFYNVNLELVFKELGKFIDLIFSNFLKIVLGVISGLGNWLILFLVPLLGIYFIDAKNKFIDWIKANFDNTPVYVFFSSFDYYQKLYIKAILVNILTIVVLSSFVFGLILGVDGISYGIVYGLFSFIPLVGPILGSLPVIIFSFGKSLYLGIVAIVSVFIIQQISDNFVTPKVIEKMMIISPFLSIISILAFYGLFNFWAVFLAVPLILAIKAVIESMGR